MDLAEAISAVLNRLGAPAGAAVLFACFYKAGALLDENTSEQSHRDFAAYLRSGRLTGSLLRLPAGTRHCFEMVFGRRHLSLRCLATSLCFSIGSTAIVFLLSALLWPELLNLLWKALTESAFGPFILGVMWRWMIWVVVVDYLNLLKTRRILSWIDAGRIRRLPAIVLVTLGDYLLGYLVFLFGFSINQNAAVLRLPGAPLDPLSLAAFSLLGTMDLSATFPPWFVLTVRTEEPASLLMALLLAASLLPSIWLWAYVFAAMITRAVARSRRLFGFLAYLLPLEEHPVRSVGMLSGALASAACLAIWALPI